jgi:hypothetical protein
VAQGNRPVVLVPGFTGSRLTTRRGTDPAAPLWIDLQAIFGPGPPPTPPVPTPWWLGEMTLAADGMTPVQNPADNRPVEGLAAISTLDPAQGAAAHYFFELIERLEAIGYDDTTLKAAPYDWRLPPMGLERRYGYFSDLKTTIEQLVAGDPLHRPVVVLGHSLGNRVIQYFLQAILNQDPAGGQAWIDRHVGRYLAVSALWLGVPKSIHEAVADLGHLGIMAIVGVKPLYQSYGALPWMFPVTEAQYPYMNTTAFAFLGGDAAPLTIETALELGGAARTLGYRQQYYGGDPAYTAPGGAIGGLAVLPPPVADVRVLYATGQPTEVGAYYVQGPGGTLVVDVDAVGSDPNFVVENGIRLEVQGTTRQRIDGTTTSGDGFLPYGSLAYFTTWPAGRPVTGQAFPGRTHYAVLRDPGFLDLVAELVSS